MKSEEVNWLPFRPNPAGVHPITLYRGLIYCPVVVEPYMPDRFLRQFGFIQSITHTILKPMSCYRGSEIKRYSCMYDTNFKAPQMYKSKMIRGMQRAHWPDQSCLEYLNYFNPRMHVRVSPDAMEVDETLNPKKLSAVAIRATNLCLFLSINYIISSIFFIIF